jgi:hypothetical protein
LQLPKANIVELSIEIAAPQTKIVELSIVTDEPSIVHPWLVSDKFLAHVADKSLVDRSTSVAHPPSTVEPILVADSSAVADFDLMVERMKLSVAYHGEQIVFLGQHLERMLILEFE